MDRETMPWREVVAIGAKVADALAFAHQQDVLHRDIKPDNILLSPDGEPLLADFGIARHIVATQTAGPAALTPAYAAPEVISGRTPTPSSDIYSLGATLFAIMAGEPAFVETLEDELPAFAYRVCNNPVPDLLRHQGIPGDVCQAIEGAMAKDPADRPPSAGAFAVQLRATLKLEPTGRTTRPYVEPRPSHDGMTVGGHSRRRITVFIAIIAAGLVLLGVAAHAMLKGPVRSASTTTTIEPTTSTTASAPVVTSGLATTIPSTAATVPAGPVLGRDLKPLSEQPCHTPGFANGSSWEVGAVRVNNVRYSDSYYCNVFSGGTGSLDFVLGRTYRTLDLTVGFADTSLTLNHVVTFTIIGDGVNYLAKPTTIQNGQVAHLVANVSATSRLTLVITETGPVSGGNDASTTVVWGEPVLSTS
jgi:serine/threonine protein kinase